MKEVNLIISILKKMQRNKTNKDSDCLFYLNDLFKSEKFCEYFYEEVSLIDKVLFFAIEEDSKFVDLMKLNILDLSSNGFIDLEEKLGCKKKFDEDGLIIKQNNVSYQTSLNSNKTQGFQKDFYLYNYVVNKEKEEFLALKNKVKNNIYLVEDDVEASRGFKFFEFFIKNRGIINSEKAIENIKYLLSLSFKNKGNNFDINIKLQTIALLKSLCMESEYKVIDKVFEMSKSFPVLNYELLDLDANLINKIPDNDINLEMLAIALKEQKINDSLRLNLFYRKEHLEFNGGSFEEDAVFNKFLKNSKWLKLLMLKNFKNIDNLTLRQGEGFWNNLANFLKYSSIYHHNYADGKTKEDLKLDLSSSFLVLTKLFISKGGLDNKVIEILLDPVADILGEKIKNIKNCFINKNNNEMEVGLDYNQDFIEKNVDIKLNFDKFLSLMEEVVRIEKEYIENINIFIENKNGNTLTSSSTSSNRKNLKEKLDIVLTRLEDLKNEELKNNLSEKNIKKLAIVLFNSLQNLFVEVFFYFYLVNTNIIVYYNDEINNILKNSKKVLTKKYFKQLSELVLDNDLSKGAETLIHFTKEDKEFDEFLLGKIGEMMHVKSLHISGYKNIIKYIMLRSYDSEKQEFEIKNKFYKLLHQNKIQNLNSIKNFEKEILGFISLVLDLNSCEASKPIYFISFEACLEAVKKQIKQVFKERLDVDVDLELSTNSSSGSKPNKLSSLKLSKPKIKSLDLKQEFDITNLSFEKRKEIIDGINNIIMKCVPVRFLDEIDKLGFYNLKQILR